MIFDYDTLRDSRRSDATINLFNFFSSKKPRNVDQFVVRIVEHHEAYRSENSKTDIDAFDYRVQTYMKIVKRLGYDHDQAAAVAFRNEEYRLCDRAVAAYHLELRADTLEERTRGKLRILKLFQRYAPDQISEDSLCEIEILQR